MIPRETLQELVQLRERVADLEQELAGLKGVDRDAELRVRDAFGLTVGLTKMLIALSRGGVMSREQLMHFGIDNHEDGSPRLVDSMVKRIRKAAPWATIHSHYGYGYELAIESALRVRAAMRGEKVQ